MTINIEKLGADMKWEARKFVISASLATAAAIGAGATLGYFVAGRPAPPTQTVIIQQTPALK